MISRRNFGELIITSQSFEKFYRRAVQAFGLTEDDRVRKTLKILYANYMARWRKTNRNKSQFESKFSSWLEVKISFRTGEVDAIPSTSSGKRGRPKKPFEDAKERTKKKIIKTEADRLSTPQAVGVLSSRLRRKGNRAGSASVRLFGSATPKSSKGMYSKLKSEERIINSFSPEEALSLLIDCKMSRKSYNLLRAASKKKGHNIYPQYHNLLEAKKLTYPKNIKAEERICQVPLQDLLNHTATRILQTIKDSVEGKFALICKWGFDGSSGQSQYKQSWEEEGSSDESVFLSSLVPLKLRREDGTEVWVNPRPSSTRFCRPIRLQFIKESSEIIRREEECIKKQIEELQPLQIGGVKIHFLMKLTMINGKALCALTGTSTLQCHICKQTEKGSASWSKSKPIDETALEYGISPLHAYIRFLEFVLDISYRLGKTSFKKVNQVLMTYYSIYLYISFFFLFFL